MHKAPQIAKGRQGKTTNSPQNNIPTTKLSRQEHQPLWFCCFEDRKVDWKHVYKPLGMI
jgi:hypothetical protein